MTQPLPSTMPAHRDHPAVSFAAIAAELADETRRRARVYPGMIAKARLGQAEADRLQALIAAIAADLEWARQYPAGVSGAELHDRPAFTWAEKRAELARELALRARHYPRWIAEGSLTQAEADHRTACLQAMLALYNDGLAWRATPGSTPEQARAEWRTTQAALDAEAAASQQELAL